ncbi:MAG TPA: nucleotidyl transferase AbiEii/AbiGii toxin family protein [Bacillota bacterium]|nr:nucleotidyl transferase AbiEii/AbiGii toxin family protein [Bacillota bacterium]HQC48395.1 nucleotidyl transferase AbiEii/AbiGii toxin family protein [Bacillota bacterium]
MSIIIEQMLKAYDGQPQTDKRNVVKEIMQEMVLCGLSRAGFFKKAVFYGGTALRIFYGLVRFSEDLDFSLKARDEDFDLTSYFPILEKEIAAFGLHVEITEKDKRVDSQIQSAFLKANTKEHLLLFYGDRALPGIHPGEKIRIKLEVDTDPPDYANFEHQYRLLPSPYEVALYDAPSLFAWKIHAVLSRAWKNRIKGRDLYDYVFFLSGSTPVNLSHLRARLQQNKYLSPSDPFSLTDLKQHLHHRFETIDYKQAKEDVIPFVRDLDSLQVWSADFFKQITNQLSVT